MRWAWWGLALLGGVALVSLATTGESGEGGDELDELGDVAVGKVSATPPEPVAYGSAAEVGDWLARLRAFLVGHGIDVEVLSPEELTWLPREGRYAIPPESYWPRILPAALIFLELRRKLGRPLAVHAYRPPEYNRTAKGAPGSRHQYFEAIDIRDTGGTSSGKRELATAAAALYLANPDRPIGLGIYGTTAPSLHVDASWRRRTWADTKHWLREVQA